MTPFTTAGSSYFRSRRDWRRTGDFTTITVSVGGCEESHCMGLFSRALETEVIINASASTVWEILTDFRRYRQWNPFIGNIVGELEEGRHIEVHFKSSGSKDRILRPKLLTVSRDLELRWLGTLLLPFLFDGEHVFRIETREEGGVRFVQSEVFRGLLVPIFWQYLNTETRRGFENMNRALKTLAEKSAT